MKTLDLSGDWALDNLDGPHSAPLRLPGDAVSALRDAGVIPDPFFGQNELLCRWVAENDWRVSRWFRIEGDPGRGWYLDLSNVDTIAEIYINGQVVATTANMFRRYRPDVSGALKPGENFIEIVFSSSVKAAAQAQAAQPWFVPFNEGNCPVPHGNMLRKTQCHFGWDWNIAVPPFGIYDPIRLRRMALGRIESVLVDQRHHDGVVDVNIRVEVFARQTGRAPLDIRLGDQAVTLSADCVAGLNRFSASFTIREPRLWWPAGSGEQPLYPLEVAFDGELERRQVGLRTIELITDKDTAGARFAFRVNGVEIFCKGANWIPADAFPSAATPERIEALVTAARDANMNMLRVWGGGLYESEAFYDACDRLGMLVWQDFMFACHLYPATPEFLAEVREEVSYQAARLQHRACLALWCGDNELIGALTWYPESRKDRDRYLVAYDRLNRTIEDALKAVVPDATWWPSSPSPGLFSFGDAWHDDRSGDMHFWSVWHENKPFEAYRSVRPRFCSEFGFQSYPSMDVIERFTTPEERNIAAPVFETHQRNLGGNERITATLFREFRFPKDFASFVYLTQIQQGLAMKTAIDFWRSLKPHCMGTLYWQLNDTWPVCSWSGLDHGGGWRALHHMTRRFYAPFTLVAVPEGEGFRISAINDGRADQSFTYRLEAVSLDGARRLIREGSAIAPTDRSLAFDFVPREALGDRDILAFSWTAGSAQGSDHIAPWPYRKVDLPDPGLEAKVSKDAQGLVVTLRAARPAFHVMLTARGAAGRFSDNAFSLMPGETRTLRFLGHAPSPSAIQIRHLQEATATIADQPARTLLDFPAQSLSHEGSAP